MPKKKHWPYEKSRQAMQSKQKTTACGSGGASPEFASRADQVTCIGCAYEVEVTRFWWGGGEPPPYEMCGYCGERVTEGDDLEQLICSRCWDEWRQRHPGRDELLLELVGYDPTPLDPKLAAKRREKRTSVLPPVRIGYPGLLQRIEHIRAMLAE